MSRPLQRRRIPGTKVVWLVLLMMGVGLWQGVGWARPKHHESKKDAKKQIERLELDWRDALIHDDVEAADRLLSDDYIGISMTGQANTKQEQLERLKTRRLRITKMDLSDQKIKLVGSVAIVTSLAVVEGSNEGQTMAGTYRYTRIYHRLPSGVWKTTNFEATRVPNRLRARD